MEKNNNENLDLDFKTWVPAIKIAAILAVIYAFFGGIWEWLSLCFYTTMAVATGLVLANCSAQLLYNLVHVMARFNISEPFAAVIGKSAVKQKESSKENGMSEKEQENLNLNQILAYLKNSIEPKKEETKAETKKEEVKKEDNLDEKMAELRSLMNQLQKMTQGPEEVKGEGNNKEETKKEEVKKEQAS